MQKGLADMDFEIPSTQTTWVTLSGVLLAAAAERCPTPGKECDLDGRQGGLIFELSDRHCPESGVWGTLLILVLVGRWE